MINIFLFLLFFTAQVKASFKDYVFSAGVGSATVQNESELRTRNGSPVLKFIPNVPSNLTLGLETKYLDLGYSFTSSEASDPKRERSKFRDLRANAILGAIDLRFNYQFYRGALVKEGGRTEFYKNYEVRSTNARAHYYFTEDYLKYIRDGYQLIGKVANNSLFSTEGSWFAGINVDRRLIRLPDILVPEHENRVDAKKIDYDSHMYAFMMGPLAGGDGTLYFHKFFVRGKFALGPAFMTAGGTALQHEFALNFGLVIAQRHLVTLQADTYSVNLNTGTAELSNVNSQAGLFYTYAFR